MKAEQGIKSGNAEKNAAKTRERKTRQKNCRKKGISPLRLIFKRKYHYRLKRARVERKTILKNEAYEIKVERL